MIQAAEFIGTELATIGLIGAGVVIGVVFGTLSGVIRNTLLRRQPFSYAILGFAFVEATVSVVLIFGVGVIIIMLLVLVALIVLGSIVDLVPNFALVVDYSLPIDSSSSKVLILFNANDPIDLDKLRESHQDANSDVNDMSREELESEYSKLTRRFGLLKDRMAFRHLGNDIDGLNSDEIHPRGALKFYELYDKMLNSEIRRLIIKEKMGSKFYEISKNEFLPKLGSKINELSKL